MSSQAQGRHHVETFLRDENGNMLAMTAAAMLVLAALVGGGLDLSRAYMVENRLQNACDAAVLAGRRAETTAGFDANAKAKAESYFAANFNETDQTAYSTSFVASSPDAGNTVVGVATTKADTLVMKIFNNTTFNLKANCQASMSVGNSDVVMVLDVTGSMDQSITSSGPSKISSLRSAMKSFYDTLAASTTGSNARIRYGLVSYSTTVNVGRLIYNLNPDFLVNSMDIQSREPTYTYTDESVHVGWNDPVRTYSTGYSNTTFNTGTLYSTTGYSKSSSCTNALPADTAWVNDGGTDDYDPTTVINGSGNKVVTYSVGQDQTSTDYYCQKASDSKNYQYSRPQYRTYFTYTIDTSTPITEIHSVPHFQSWLYKKRTYNVSQYKTFAAVTTDNGSNGANQSYTWNGCIEERQSVNDSTFTFSGSSGISPAAAYDLDIDLAPSSDATRWRPLFGDVSYYRTDQYNNPSQVATSTYGKKASAPCPVAARLLAPMDKDTFYDYADDLVTGGNTYHDIGMIWGARLSSPTGIFASTVNEAPSNGGEVSRHIIFMTDGQLEPNNLTAQAYGIELLDKRITSNGSTSDAARHNSRFRVVCDAAKAKGLRIWVIAFSTGLNADLTYCASTDSAFTANSSSELNTAFQEIAKQVGELRVVQ